MRSDELLLLVFPNCDTGNQEEDDANRDDNKKDFKASTHIRMKRQCTFTVKRSTSEARRAKLTGSKLIKKYKQAELVKIVKLGEMSL